jgi:ubiquinone/menaquinone biosynthesis C-methylase UbiE
VIRKYFKAIYVVDVSPSLLEVAQRRVHAMQLQDIVHIVGHDFTAPSVFTAMPNLEGKVDWVTFSYSLSMIPDKATALLHAMKFLQPRGHGVLGLADFFLSSNDDDALPLVLALLRKVEATCQRKWFEMDRIHLIGPQVIRKLEKVTDCVWDERFRGGVPLLPILRPYHGAYVAVTGGGASGNGGSKAAKAQ